MADIATTLVVALTYWTVAVLRDAARSLGLAGRRVRRRGTLQLRGMLRTDDTRGLSAQPFEPAEAHCVRPPGSRV